MYKQQLFFRLLSVVFIFSFSLSSCEKKPAEEKNSNVKPNIYTPETEVNNGNDKAAAPDSAVPEIPLDDPKPMPPSRVKLPSKAELETITPSQEAKRALTNDATKASRMSLTEFGDYMKSRIPYYKGKGEFKFENDIVRIQITKTEMAIQTAKGKLTFPMQ